MNVRGLARSTLYVNLAQVWQVASRVVLTPVVIAALGLTGYGTWVLLFGVCSYVIGVSASFGVAYGKLTAELDRQGDYAGLRQVIGAGMALTAGVASLGLIAIWLLHAALLPLLGVEAALYVDAERALLVLLIGTLVHVSLGCTLQVLGGLQRVDLQYGAGILGSVVNFVSALWLLRAGTGLVALPLGFLVGELVAVGVAWWLCRRLRPGLAFSPLHASLSGFRQITALGIRFQGVLLLVTVVRQGVRLLLSALCGTAALGTFNLADRLLYVARTPAMAVVTPLVPAFANLASGGDQQRWGTLFARASRALVMAGAVPLLFAALFADAVLYAWTGQHYPQAAWTARVLAPADFAVLLTTVATSSLRAAGTVRLELTMGFVNAALVFLGMAVGYPLGGYAGIVVAVAAGRAASALWFLQRSAGAAPLRVTAMATARLIWPAAVLAPVVIAVAVAGSALPAIRAADSHRATVLLLLLLLAAACVLASALVAWRVVCSPAERALLRQLMPTKRKRS